MRRIALLALAITAMAAPAFARGTPGTMDGTDGIPGFLNVTTSATAGVSTQLVAVATLRGGFVLQNNCTTAIWWSNSQVAGTALTASNALALAAGATFVTPDWWSPSGALIVASQTAAACSVSAVFR